MEVAQEEGSDEEEESDGGWFDRAVETSGDILGGAKDVVVDTAGSVWGVLEDTPGAVWDFIKGVPGALGGLIVSGWNWLKDTTIELEEWRVFLESHWLLGVILGPIVQLLIGLAPDGTISYLELGLGILLFVIPGAKGAQFLKKGFDNLLPWVNDVDNAVGAVRRNPGGFFDGIADTYRFSRAKAITPSVDDFGKLPTSPGVYVAVDAQGTPLYIGMSNSLVRRVPQHFDNTPGPFAGSTQKIKILPTKTVPEARALECALIKTFMPEHNQVHKNANVCRDYTKDLFSLIP
jgi:hypothetical protein